MTVLFLPKFDLRTYRKQDEGVNDKLFSYVKAIHTTLQPADTKIASEYLAETLGVYDTSFDVTSFVHNDDIVALLDAGASRVFVTPIQFESLIKADNLDRNRLVISIHRDVSESTLKMIQSDDELSINLPSATGDEDLFSINTGLSKENIIKRKGLVFAELTRPQLKLATSLSSNRIVPIIEERALTTSQADSDGIQIADLLMVRAVSDRADGLFATLVTDERGIALGLVYSSRESVSESLRTGRGVYQSRKRGLWYKGETSGDIQELVNISFDCDEDCLRFTVRQKGKGFCHLGTETCFGQYRGLSRLQNTLKARKISAPPSSYTARLFSDPHLLAAKIKEEANELCEATEKSHIAFEAADLLYFALTKCIAADVSLEDVEKQLDAKSLKVTRRPGNAKPGYENGASVKQSAKREEVIKEAASIPKSKNDPAGVQDNKIQMTRYNTAEVSRDKISEVLQRPSQKSTEMIMGIVKPIVEEIRIRGDKALLEYTHKFEKATTLKSPVIHAPFPQELMQLSPETIEAIDVSYENIRKFHAAQKEEKPLAVETMPGVVCSRFARAIERVGLYVPGGTAVLPSSALMLGVPAMVAGCQKIVLASPPRSDGSVTPEIVYIAHKIGAESIVLAGGAQAIAALAYGTESVSKVDKILGPGNQFVTAGKMLVSNDTSAGVSIDMPAGPSEVLVIADKTSNPAFVASDLLSQAEHGTDSQVVLIAVDMTSAEVSLIEDELHAQASALPRVDIVRGAINHSVTLQVRDINEAMELSNQYAPEHLIIQTADPDKAAELVKHAGSVFIGPWTPESVGDYSAGVNHSLPTYGYARQYSGVNLASYIKHITSSKLTQQGLRNLGSAVMQLAKVEELEAHRRAVSIRLAHMDGTGRGY